MIDSMWYCLQYYYINLNTHIFPYLVNKKYGVSHYRVPHLSGDMGLTPLREIFSN